MNLKCLFKWEGGGEWGREHQCTHYNQLICNTRDTCPGVSYGRKVLSILSLKASSIPQKDQREKSQDTEYPITTVRAPRVQRGVS